jgi:tripartite-type tricarboxylate transporter receptor subunit TctC
MAASNVRTGLVAALLLACSSAHPQAFPNAPIRILMPNPPGAPNDTLTRGMLEPLSKAFGQPVVIDNRVGADGIIGMEACARAVPDGHSICSTYTGLLTFNPVVRRTLPYDPARDLSGVAFLGFFDSVLVVHASVPAISVKELVDATRSKPGSIVWGHFGLNTTGYFYEEWLKKSRQAQFLVVSYKSTPQILQAMLAGEAHAMVFSWPQLLPHIRSGKLKALAVTSDRRMPFLADVPTFDEEGMKLPLRGWFAFHAPSAMPRAIVQRWHAEITRIASEPAYREKFVVPLGLSGGPWSPEELDGYVRGQIVEMAALAKFIGLQPE